MSLLRDLAGGVNPAENPENRLTGGLLLSILDQYSVGMGGKTSSGKVVTPENSLKLVAVYRAVTLISGLIGSIPLKSFDSETHEERFIPLLEEPTPGMTKFEFRELLAGHLATHGNFDAFKVKTDGVTTALLPFKPGRITYDTERPSAANPSGRVYKIADDQGTIVSRLTDNEVFHVPLFSLDGFVGLSPIGMAREAIASGLSAEEFANKLWQSGILASGILVTDQNIDDPKAQALKRRWQERTSGLDAAYNIAVMDRGAKFQPLSMPPSDAQFIESRSFTVSEIARLFGLPPHLLSQQERQTSWGTGIEQHNIGFVVYTLSPIWLVRIEQRLLALAREASPELGAATVTLDVKFKVQGLMRGDSGARSVFYARMYRMGALNPNEIRAYEDLPPRDGGDEYFDPMASMNDEGETPSDGDDSSDEGGGDGSGEEGDELTGGLGRDYPLDVIAELAEREQGE